MPSGTAVIATGCKQVAGLASRELQESWPVPKPLLNDVFAAVTASSALPGTPGASVVPPAVPSKPPVNVFEYGGFAPIRSTMLPGSKSLKRPKPVLITVLGAICQASAVRG